jgi:esterase
MADDLTSIPAAAGPLTCVDFGGDGPTVLALHGTFGRGRIFAPLAARLEHAAHLVAPDQRGHGRSSKQGPFTREAFIADAAAAAQFLGGGTPIVVLGHSLGGITAYQLAARRPELVAALIIEDVGPVMARPQISAPGLDVRGWPRRAATRAQLAAALHAHAPNPGYFMASASERDGGVELLFDWDQMMEVQHHGVGDWWNDWLASSCPALVVRGGRSTLLPTSLAQSMAARRPHTRLAEFPEAGHWVHDDDPDGMATAVKHFLQSRDVSGAA